MLQRNHKFTYAGIGITAAGIAVAALWTAPSETAHSRAATPVISQQAVLEEQTVSASKLFDAQRLKVESLPVRLKPEKATHLPVVNDLCLNGSAKPRCREAFESAIAQTNAFSAGSADFEAVVEGSRVGGDKLRFVNNDWKHRLKRVGKEGIAFARIPHGRDQEVLIGLNRKGMLGVQLKAKSNY